MRVPVKDGAEYEVLDPDGRFDCYNHLKLFWSNVCLKNVSGVSVDVQLVPIPMFVQTIPGRVSKATQELVFLATELPPLDTKSYYVKKVANNRRMFKSKYNSNQHDVLDDNTISNEVFSCILF